MWTIYKIKIPFYNTGRMGFFILCAEAADAGLPAGRTIKEERT